VVLDASMLLSPTAGHIAYTRYDSEGGTQELIIKDTVATSVISITIPTDLTALLLSPVGWSADETYVYLQPQADEDGIIPAALYRVDLTDNTITPVSIVSDLSVLNLDVRAGIDRAIGITQSSSGVFRKTTNSTLELITLSQNLNRTLIQTTSGNIDRALLSPSGLLVAYQITRDGITSIRFASPTESTAPTTELAGTLLGWATDSNHLIYRTAKQLRSYNPGTGTDTVLATDSLDNPIGSDPYVIEYIGAFGD